jgi:hypothetical protein
VWVQNKQVSTSRTCSAANYDDLAKAIAVSAVYHKHNVAAQVTLHFPVKLDCW